MKTLLLAILLLPGSLYLGAQERRAQVKQLADNYCSVAGNYVSLYSGKEQLKYMTGVTGHPYWVDDSYAPASLYYDGIFYEIVLLRLDIYRDELIIISPDVRFHVILVGDYLGWADFHGSRVIYHTKNSLPGSPSTGYYIRLYSGEYTVLEKQNKYFYSQVLDRRVEHLFSDKKSTYYC
ncbi:MAG: hypothetical protein LUE93_03915 [Bacteroides sp.]|nr:hypothetical protein [Bacteroides sp.]